jgi:hypothetical protein
MTQFKKVLSYSKQTPCNFNTQYSVSYCDNKFIIPSNVYKIPSKLPSLNDSKKGKEIKPTFYSSPFLEKHPRSIPLSTDKFYFF